MLRLSTGHSDILQTDIAKGGETRPVCIENGKRGTMQKLRKIISALSAAAVFTARAASAGAASLDGYYESFDNIKDVSTEFGKLTPIGNTAATAAAAGLKKSAADSGDGIEQVSAQGKYAVKLGSSSNYGLGVYNTKAELNFNQEVSTNSLYFSFDAYQYKNETASDNANTVVKLTDASNNTIFSYKFDISTGNVTDVKIGGETVNPSGSATMNSNELNHNVGSLAYLNKPIRVEFSLNNEEAKLTFSTSERTFTANGKLESGFTIKEFTITDNSDDPGRMYTIDNLFAGTSETPYAVSSVVKEGGRVYGNDNKAADTYVLTVTPYNGTITSVAVKLGEDKLENTKSDFNINGSAQFGIVVMDDKDEDGEAYLNSINESSFDVTCGFENN